MKKLFLAGLSIVALAACENNGGDTTRDFGQGDGDLSELQADGIEGYLSARLDRNGKPVCSGIAPPGYAVGNFKGGADIGDNI